MAGIQTSEHDIDFSVARPGTNVILVAEEQEIHVNKEFLSFSSPYFNTLLMCPNFAESSSPRVNIEHDYVQLLKCIQVVHGNCIPGSMSLSELEKLLQSADFFDLPVVRRFCSSELVRYNAVNKLALDPLLIACQYKLQTAKDALLPKTTKFDWHNWSRYLNHTDPAQRVQYQSWQLLRADAADIQLNLSLADLHSIIRRTT